MKPLPPELVVVGDCVVGPRMNWVPVQVDFLSRSQGGRTHYACTTVIRRGAASEERSVALDLTASPPHLRFLVDAAPHDLLVPGTRLDLREGARTIGTALIRPTVGDRVGLKLYLCRSCAAKLRALAAKEEGGVLRSIDLGLLCDECIKQCLKTP